MTPRVRRLRHIVCARAWHVCAHASPEKWRVGWNFSSVSCRKWAKCIGVHYFCAFGSLVRRIIYSAALTNITYERWRWRWRRRRWNYLRQPVFCCYFALLPHRNISRHFASGFWVWSERRKQPLNAFFSVVVVALFASETHKAFTRARASTITDSFIIILSFFFFFFLANKLRIHSALTSWRSFPFCSTLMCMATSLVWCVGYVTGRDSCVRNHVQNITFGWMCTLLRRLRASVCDANLR